ncbi:phytanoyl-CoA dioxygenase family protein [Primorskyibacter aestuariivivens]|uniref:phytanoyl-CoA dioxygenase family protein n=1 Tax=Primorskyibacter aestuariivivens TaxID=1888912 RepID=UPI0022FFFC3F|nr:phytanoyl-CoA dioxygenase family protein [Primorskyibacter aestuariivivens]MDA7427630.1 phytanoyl-CoA dioxygenase family protein [Primorskyibacter aestuariivivens]
MLTQSQIATYHDAGVLHPVPVFAEQEARELRDEVEQLERQHASGAGQRPLSQYFRVNGQIVLPLLSRVARTPAILDAVEALLGPDLLVWSVELFIKEPGTDSLVSWHQDITYWGMGETDDEVTAWIALSDVSVEAGCMRFIPGSHRNPIVAHEDTHDSDNLLSRGQQIAGIDETKAQFGPLKPGEMSLHHGRCFHASGPNRSGDRRIGMAIRYVTPDVRQSDLGRDYAMLVRGRDARQGWINIAAPTTLFEPGALRLYEEVLAHQSATLAAGADQDVALYDHQGAKG